jgi:CubicO group peptidase (beta-lactamase class C family)
MALLAGLAGVVLSATVWAQGLPTAKPEEVGLSSQRLARVTEAFKTAVNDGIVSGAVMLVARDGKVVFYEAVGKADAAAGTPMAKDSIFRLYSMTKPFTSAAVLMLVEEGKLLLSDPITKYLPQLGKRSVGVEKKDAAGKVELVLEPARREITVQDLLRHTSGLTYGVFGKSLVKDQYKSAGVDEENITNAELVERLAKVPLLFQPGTAFEYGRSTDVLGRLVEVVSGKNLGQFLSERIIAPLKLKDTAFHVPGAKLGRLAQAGVDPQTKKVPDLLDVTKPPTYEAGGQGLVGTAQDYVRIAQMYLNGGELDGVRLLGRKTVELMTSDHLEPAMVQNSTAYLPGPGYGFGLGFAVRRDAGVSAVPGSVGDYNWSGFGGTTFWVDPKERLIGVLMTQAPGQRLYTRQLFKTLVMQSIIK